MTNALAIWVGGFLVTALILDQVFLDGSSLLFLVKKIVELAGVMAFWR